MLAGCALLLLGLALLLATGSRAHDERKGEPLERLLARVGPEHRLRLAACPPAVAREPPGASPARLAAETAYRNGGRASIEEYLACKRASAEAEGSAEAFFRLASEFEQFQWTDEAEASYLQALDIERDHALATLLLGNLYQSTDRPQLALAAFARAHELVPSSGTPHNNMGLIHQSLGELDRAETMFRRSLDIAEASHMAHNNLGTLLRGKGNAEQALVHFRRAAALEPASGEVWLNVATTLVQLERHEDADEAFETARPLLADRDLLYAEWIGSRMSRGDVATAARLADDALATEPTGAHPYRGQLFLRAAHVHTSRASHLDALRVYDDCVALLPALARCHSGRGDAFYHLGRFAAATDAYQEALRLDPQLSGALNGLASAQLMDADLVAATASYQRAVDADAGDVLARINLIHAKARICDWSTYAADAAYLAALAENEPDKMNVFHALAYPLSPAHLLAIARARAHSELQIFARDDPAVADALPPPTPLPTADAPLVRIGFISSDLVNHPVGHLVQGIFQHFDRRRFHVTCYSLAPRDDGAAPQRRARRDADAFVDAGAMSRLELASRIRSDGIHVLFNLNGYTMHARNDVLALQPAPIQAVLVGFAGTMGAPYIQYLVTDRVSTPPEIASAFEEKLVYLPNTLLVNSYRETRARVLDNAPTSLSVLGLDDAADGNSFLFCNFNNLHKLDPPTFASWMRILHAVPESRLWLMRMPAEGEPNLRREAERAGIDADRLLFTDRFPLEDHLSVKSLCHLFLDTYEYNAHTTAAEALWAAVPVLTLPGDKMVSRVAASLIGAVGLADSGLVAHSRAAYEATAVRLATSPLELRAVRDRLVANRMTEPLFDTRRWVAELEAAVEAMVERGPDGPRHCVA